MKIIKVVTRGSKLAIAQTEQTVKRLKEKNPSVSFEVIQIKTLGDRVKDKPLSQFRGVGVFVKELEQALLSGDADIAIHSLKDIPAELPDGLELCCFPERENPSDLLITDKDYSFSELPFKSVIGTSSPRRMIQLKATRPDIVFKELRGNLDTRISKLKTGQYDAIVVAAAGMARIGLTFEKRMLLPYDICLPAIGQGALAIECRTNDSDAKKIISKSNDAKTEYEVKTERAFMKAFGAGCSAPVAAVASARQNRMGIKAVYGDLDRTEIIRIEHSGDVKNHQEIGEQLAEMLKKKCEKTNA